MAAVPMSSALYKFLQKRVLEGKPGATTLMDKYAARSRHKIIERLANVIGPGEGSYLDSLPFYNGAVGDTGKRMLKESKEAIFGGLDIADGEARNMFVKWLTKRPEG